MAEKTIFAGIEPKTAPRSKHRVAVLAYDGVVLGDLAVPLEIFERVRDAHGEVCYDVRICSIAREVKSRHVTLQVPWRLSSARSADTLIVPGMDDIESSISPTILRTLTDVLKSGARIASICTGAFVLARAGLLDGLRATTHWEAAGELARRYPRITVDPNVLFVDNGQLLTSAGAAAGMDLCLYIIRRDHGASVAASTAKRVVMPIERAGGQAQFIVHKLPDTNDSLGQLLGWMEQNLQHGLSLSVIARRARMSTRTLSRRFLEQIGTTPVHWIAQARVRRAQHLLETTQLPIERIATEVGFRSASVLREHFSAAVGVPPITYRRSFTATVQD